MHYANFLVQVLEAIDELLEEVSNKWLRQSVVYFDQSVQLAILCKVHHVVADWTRALDEDRL